MSESQNDLFEKLNSLDDVYDASEEVSPFEDVPDGEYLTKITTFEMGNTKEKGYLMAKICYTILDTAFINRLIFQNFVLERDNPDDTMKAMGIFKGFLGKIGIKDVKLSYLATDEFKNTLKTIGIKLKKKTTKSTKDDGKEYVNLTVKETFAIEDDTPAF